MQIFGLWEKLTSLIFSSNSNTVTIDPGTPSAPRTWTIPDASANFVGDTTTQTLTGKTIDGDDNTVQDLPETALKTVPANASKFFTRDGSGIPESTAKAVPTGDVVGTTDTQTLSAKTLSSPQIDTPTLPEYMDLGHETTPANPAAGFIRLYPKNDNTLYILDSTGTETPIGSGGDPRVTTDLSQADVTVASGTTLAHPFLTIDTGFTYTVTGRLLVAGTLTIDGTVTGAGDVIVTPTS